MFASSSSVARAPRVSVAQRVSGVAGPASPFVVQLPRRANTTDVVVSGVRPCNAQRSAVAAKSGKLETAATVMDATPVNETDVSSSQKAKRSPKSFEDVGKIDLKATSTTAPVQSSESNEADNETESTPFTVEINVDRRPDRAFLTDISNASSVKEWTALVKGRDMSRSATELGAALAALRRLQRDDAGFSKGTSRILYTWLAIMKKNVPRWPSRSIANSVSAMVALKHCDKLLMLKVAQTVTKRIKANPTSFKLVELSQICWSCKMMNFRNLALMRAVSKGIQAATPEMINPTSLAVLLAFIPHLDYYDSKLMNFLLEKLLEKAEVLSVEECKSAFLGCARLQFLEGKEHFYRLQDTLRRQKKSRISRSDAFAILLSLLHLEALQPETAEALQSCLVDDGAAWSERELAVLNAVVESMKLQGHTRGLDLPAELLERAAQSAGSQPVRMSSVVAGVKDVIEKELGLPVRSIRSRQGWGVPIFVKESYAVCVVTPRHYLLRNPSQLNGQITLLTRSLKAEGITPVIVNSSPSGKDLMWTSPNAQEHVKEQADYVRSCLPAEIFEA